MGEKNSVFLSTTNTIIQVAVLWHCVPRKANKIWLKNLHMYVY